MKKLIVWLFMLVAFASPSFARGFRVYFPIILSAPEPVFCSTPYIYSSPDIFFPYPYGPVYQPQPQIIVVFPRQHFINYGGRIIR